MLNNLDVLYPIFPNVMFMLKSVFSELEVDIQNMVHDKICELIDEKSHLIASDINLSFELRVLSECPSSHSKKIMIAHHRPIKDSKHSGS